MIALPSTLREAYREGRLILFVGAGVSISVDFDDAGTPAHGLTWTELVEYAAGVLGFNDLRLLRVRGSDLQILEYYRQEVGEDLGQLKTWFNQHMQPSDSELRAAPILNAIVSLTKLRLIYTTNFDNFLERAFKVAGREFTPVVVEPDLQRFLKATSSAPNTVRIMKFHGDIDHPSALVVTEEQYEARLRLEALLDQQLLADLIGRVVLFIGYSFSDWNVAYLFWLFNRLHGPGSPSGHRAYIAVPDPSAFERKLFARRNIEILTIPTLDKTAGITEILESLEA